MCESCFRQNKNVNAGLWTHLLSCLAFGLLFFLLALFRFFGACCCRTTCFAIILSSACAGRYVCLLLTIPVKKLLSLRIVVILKVETAICMLKNTLKEKRRSITHYKCTDQTEKHATHTRWMCTTYLCIWVIIEASLRIIIVARRLIILIGGCIRNSCELANTTALTMVVKIFLGKLEKTGIEIKTHSRFISTKLVWSLLTNTQLIKWKALKN